MTERDAIMDTPPDEWHRLFVTGALAYKRYLSWKNSRNRVLDLERDGAVADRQRIQDALAMVRSRRELYDEARELFGRAVGAL